MCLCPKSHSDAEGSNLIEIRVLYSVSFDFKILDFYHRFVDNLCRFYHRWDLPESENSVLASTANELRRDRYGTPVNPEKLKAAGEGLQHSMFTSLLMFIWKSIFLNLDSWIL